MVGQGGLFTVCHRRWPKGGLVLPRASGMCDMMHEAAIKLQASTVEGVGDVAAVDLGERDRGPMQCTPSASWAGVAGKWLCWGPTPATGDNSIQYHLDGRVGVTTHESLISWVRDGPGTANSVCPLINVGKRPCSKT